MEQNGRNGKEIGAGNAQFLTLKKTVKILFGLLIFYAAAAILISNYGDNGQDSLTISPATFLQAVIAVIAVFAPITFALRYFSPEQRGIRKYGKEEWEKIKKEEREKFLKENGRREYADAAALNCPFCFKIMERREITVAGEKIILRKCPAHGAFLAAKYWEYLEESVKNAEWPFA